MDRIGFIGRNSSIVLSFMTIATNLRLFLSLGCLIQNCRNQNLPVLTCRITG